MIDLREMPITWTVSSPSRLVVDVAEGGQFSAADVLATWNEMIRLAQCHTVRFRTKRRLRHSANRDVRLVGMRVVALLRR